MKFNPGDIVIKNTGGNRMTILGYSNNEVNCAWVSDNYHEGFFHEDELISIKEYKCMMINEKRNDFINQILN